MKVLSTADSWLVKALLSSADSRVSEALLSTADTWLVKALLSSADIRVSEVCAVYINYKD